MGDPAQWFTAIALFATAYFALANVMQTLLLGTATAELRERRFRLKWERRTRLLASRAVPQVSILVPAYDEEATVTENVRALLSLQYPRLELVVVNDGSLDGTLEALVERFDLYPVHPIFRRIVETQPIRGIYRSRTGRALVVIDKENGGKADALNAGLNVASGDLVCAVDADTLIEPDAMLRILHPFLAHDDTIAAGGTVRVANGSQIQAGLVISAGAPLRALPGVQDVEYLRAFLFGRLGWNRLGENIIISGAFGLFRRDALLEAGGYARDTVGEDVELVLRLRRVATEDGWERRRIGFVPDPVVWTEVPSGFRPLGRQRDRWHRGLADTLWRHRRVLGNPRYGPLGLVVAPYFLVIELLAPVVEVIAWAAIIGGLALGFIDLTTVSLFLLIAYGWGLVLSLLAVALEQTNYHYYGRWRDRLAMVAWAFLENIGYRQLNTLWRLRGLASFLLRRSDWGAMPRRGFETAADR